MQIVKITTKFDNSIGLSDKGEMEVFNVSEKLAKQKPQCKENINKYLKQ